MKASKKNETHKKGSKRNKEIKIKRQSLIRQSAIERVWYLKRTTATDNIASNANKLTEAAAA